MFLSALRHYLTLINIKECIPVYLFISDYLHKLLLSLIFASLIINDRMYDKEKTFITCSDHGITSII